MLDMLSRSTIDPKESLEGFVFGFNRILGDGYEKKSLCGQTGGKHGHFPIQG